MQAQTGEQTERLFTHLMQTHEQNHKGKMWLDLKSL